MSLAARTFRLHRWLGWLVGLQVLLWVGGGLVFSLLPFQAWVKSGDAIAPPTAMFAPGWAERLAPALQAATADAPVAALAVVATPLGPALRVSRMGGPPRLLPADGSAWREPTADEVRRFASALHRQGAPVVAAERIAEAPRRLGLVDETGGRRDLWRVRFDDALATRVYLDGPTGVFVAARNEAWVWYDFFFRLHVMNYGDEEDLNSLLLRAATLAAAVLVAAGSVLSLRAAWRAMKKARRGERRA